MVVILVVLADCNEWEEIEDYAKDEKKFLRKFLKLTGGIPSAKTYERVISLIDCQELNKIFVETVGTIKKCDIDAINEAVDLFFDQDEPTDLIQIFVANTIQILNQPDLLVDVLGLSVLINEIIINHQLDDFNPNLWKMNHHRFFSIDYRDYLGEDENQEAYN